MSKELFTAVTMPHNFYWLNEPDKYQFGQGMDIFTNAETDFWQRTHYGFQRDNGHCLLTKVTGDFSLSTQVSFEPTQQYDQCGLMIRLDKDNWIKVAVEYEDEEFSRLGSVVTNEGYSDWATQDISSRHTEMCYRVQRRGDDFLLESAFAGAAWKQMRLTHLLNCQPELEVGLYACSPIGRGFHCRFSWLALLPGE
jgi:regulation of enolase protein 1 (concanavalin A-like superfamily)